MSNDPKGPRGRWGFLHVGTEEREGGCTLKHGSCSRWGKKKIAESKQDSGPWPGEPYA